MSGYPLGRSAATRPFIVTPYVSGRGGVLVPALPAEGPCGDAGEGPCRITVHHFRERGTGPCHPLTVVRCAVHRQAFTLYPPGHVPYGRKAIALSAPDGSAITPLPETAADPVIAPWSWTLFEAALDAHIGHAWPRDGEGGRGAPSWRTQRRHLARGARLLGVDPALDETTRSQVARELGVPLGLLCEGADTVRRAPGYRSLGRAQAAVLCALAWGPTVWRRLAVTGHRTTVWGPPHAWEEDVQALRPLPFHPFGTGPPPPTGGGAPTFHDMDP